MIERYSLPVPEKCPNPKQWATEYFNKILELSKVKHSAKDYTMRVRTEGTITRVYFKLRKK